MTILGALSGTQPPWWSSEDDDVTIARHPDDVGKTDRRRRWVDIVRKELGRSATPGAAVALVVDGQTVFAAGVGSRDLEHAAPIPADGRFYVYSVTKTLLAVITLQLVAAGRLALDEPAQAFLPALPFDTPVTARQLLNHSAGLPEYGGAPEYAAAVRARPAQPWTPDDFLAFARSRGLRFPPGAGWAYSNLGYLVIRLLIERVTGLSLRAAVATHIAEPLGLRRTFVAETLADAGVLVPGYSAFFSSDRSPDGALTDITPLYAPGWVSHGVVVSTAPELARVTEALFTGHLLPSELLPTMLAPTLVPGEHDLFGQPAYGLGVMLDARSPHGVVAGHAGGGPGYSSAILHLSNVAGHRVTSVALANRDVPDLGLQIAFALARSLDRSPGTARDDACPATPPASRF